MSCRAVLAVCSSKNIPGHQTQGGADIKEPFSGESLRGFASVNSMVVWVSLLLLVIKYRVARTLMGKDMSMLQAVRRGSPVGGSRYWKRWRIGQWVT
jgi:hypothetical protein